MYQLGKIMSEPALERELCAALLDIFEWVVLIPTYHFLFESIWVRIGISTKSLKES